LTNPGAKLAPVGQTDTLAEARLAPNGEGIQTDRQTDRQTAFLSLAETTLDKL